MRFMEKSFEENHDITVGVEFGSKIVSVDGINVKIQVWDTVNNSALSKGWTREFPFINTFIL